MATRVAVLLDGGCVRTRLGKAGYAFDVQNTLALGMACVDGSAGEELFRLYYYDCEPYGAYSGKKEKNPISGQVVKFPKRQSTVQRELAKREYVAYRQGKLAWRGWTLTGDA